MSNQSTQKRQYDSFGPHFRIETGNPQLGVAGNICYNLYGQSDSSDVTNIGMMGDGQLQIMADQCITIDGGASVEGGGCCVNIIGSNKLSPEFLKNSTSSNKFKIRPKQKAIRIELRRTFV